MAKITAFDRHAAEYDAWFKKHDGLYQAELEALRAFIPASGHGVEIGVGTGRFAVPLGISVGVEPSLQMAALARQRGIEVLEGQAEALPLPDNSFDYAAMVTVICFLDDVAMAFKEAWRILKVGGSFVVGFIDRESELGRIYDQNKGQSSFYRDATFYSTSEVETLLTKAGFTELSYRQTILPGETTRLNVREGHASGGFVVIRTCKTLKGDIYEGRNHPLSID